MRTAPTDSRRGFTLIELLVVIAIIAILIGLLLPAVQKVREAASRAESMNKLKQLALASHSYQDANKNLPPTDMSSYSNGGMNGSWTFAILPYIEQETVQKSTYGPTQYNQVYKENYNGQIYDYSYSGPTGYTGYQASKAKGKLKAFYSKLDPTAEAVDSPASYFWNSSIYGYSYDYGGGSKYEYGMSLTKITDGTSNTALLAEGYSQCKQTQFYDYSQYYGAGSYYKYSYGYTRIWNYDGLTSNYNIVYTYVSSPYKVDYSSTGSTSATYSSYGSYDSTSGNYVPFQVRPKPDNCDPFGVQAAGSALVAMCDGSVRSISPSVSMTTWSALGTPQGGEVLGNDW